MSGDDLPTLEIVGDEAPASLRLLPTLGRVRDELEALGRELVIAGGLAVIARVTTADRATTDIDSVLDAPDGTDPTVELPAAAKVGSPADDAPQRRVVDGVPVDFIDTHPISDADLHGIDGRKRPVRRWPPLRLRNSRDRESACWHDVDAGRIRTANAGRADSVVDRDLAAAANLFLGL